MISLNETWETLPKESSSSFQLGPFTISISSTNQSLAKALTKAFAHLPQGEGTPDFEIRLWSGHKLPPLDWSLIQTNGYRGYQEPPFYFHHFETIGALSAIDTKENIAYYAIRDPDSLPWWVSGSPLQVILHVWLREKGFQLTHAASISNKKSAILLTGKGGSGKSTTLLSCLEGGLDTLGEDYLLIGPDQIYTVYQTAKWAPHTRTLFPNYEPHIANPSRADQEKALVYYKDLFPTQLTLSSPSHAIVSLEVGTSAHLKKSDFHTSLQSLLLTTAMQLPFPDPRTTSLLSAFTKPLAHYRLTLGPNLQENVSFLRGLF